MEFVSVSQLNDLLIKFCDDCPAVRSKKEESKDKSFFQSPWFFLKEYQRFVSHILLFLKREISAMFRRSATPGAKSNNCGKLQDTRPWTTIPVVKMFTFNYCQSFRFIHLRQPAAMVYREARWFTVLLTTIWNGLVRHRDFRTTQRGLSRFKLQHKKKSKKS